MAADEVRPFGDDQLTAHLAGPGSPLLVYLAVDGTGQMSDLVFQPDVQDPPTTLEELIGQLAASGETTAFLRADIAADGPCAPVAELDARPGCCRSGRCSSCTSWALWRRRRGRSRFVGPTESWSVTSSTALPAGVTQDDPPGSSLRVQRPGPTDDPAERQHGHRSPDRPRRAGPVEAALVDLGHSRSDGHVAVPTTRELFVIKSDPQTPQPATEAADVEERRALLATDVAAAPLPSTHVGGVGTAPPPCRRWSGSLPRPTSAAPWSPSATWPRNRAWNRRRVLGARAARHLDRRRFPTVWFKGGSEPGVMFVTWLATRPDGRLTVVAGGVADSTINVDEDLALIQLLGRGLTLG